MCFVGKYGNFNCELIIFVILKWIKVYCDWILWNDNDENLDKLIFCIFN